MNHVFGPVPSRRLGRSLGVDPVPFKTCTYDCIYCQLGRTRDLTLERKEWFPIDDIVRQVRDRLSAKPDYITLSGSGEPTLYARTGELIDRIRSMSDIPVAVLTNGSLLWREEVRRQLADANLVVPSLDAGDEQVFRSVNRPCDGISFDRMVEGLIDFTMGFRGETWLEVFIVDGYNAGDAECGRIAGLVKTIGPGRVQLNTVTRPPAESAARQAPEERMSELAGLFDPRAEVVAEYRDRDLPAGFSAARESVLETISRRPCTEEDIARGLGLHINEAIKQIEKLLAEGIIIKTVTGGRTYFLRPEDTKQKE